MWRTKGSCPAGRTSRLWLLMQVEAAGQNKQVSTVRGDLFVEPVQFGLHRLAWPAGSGTYLHTKFHAVEKFTVSLNAFLATCVGKLPREWGWSPFFTTVTCSTFKRMISKIPIFVMSQRAAVSLLKIRLSRLFLSPSKHTLMTCYKQEATVLRQSVQFLRLMCARLKIWDL